MIEELDTPMYIFDIDVLKQRIKYLKEHLAKRIELCYAIKANTFIIKEINDDVERFEVCSPGEYSVCEEMQITPEKIVISGVYKTPSSIDEMMINNKNIGRYTAESIEQLRLLDELSCKHNLKINVLLRLTSGNQFGINEEDIEEILQNKDKLKNINIVGIQYFSGTQKRTTKRLQREIEYLDEFLNTLKQKYNYVAEELEFGGGFPVFYFKGDEFDEDKYLEEFSSIIDNMNYKGRIILELGRSIAASCGTYITKVVDKKTNKGENYAILDGGINHLVYFGQTMAMKVPHFKIYPERDEDNIQNWNLMGSLCTTNDILVKQLPISNLNIGDTFVFENTGAYCMTEGISLFLSRELPKVALKKNNELKIVRDAFKTYKLNMSNY